MTKVGHASSFSRHSYQPTPIRIATEFQPNIRALQAETDNRIAEIAGGRQ
jgi:type I restriction enzyme M protein